MPKASKSILYMNHLLSCHKMSRNRIKKNTHKRPSPVVWEVAFVFSGFLTTALPKKGFHCTPFSPSGSTERSVSAPLRPEGTRPCRAFSPHQPPILHVTAVMDRKLRNKGIATRSKKLLGTTGKRVTDVLSTYRIARASSRKLPAPEGGGACLKKRLHPGFGSYIFRRTGCPHQSEFGPGEYVFDSRRSEFAPCIEIWHSEEGRWLSS